MAVVSAEVQRALERWVNQLRSELKDTRAELQEARRRAKELEAECESHRTAAKETQLLRPDAQQELRVRELEAQVTDSFAESQQLREELAEMARLCKRHERDARDLRAEVRGEQAKAALLRDERSGRGAKRSALSEQLQAAQKEVAQLKQETRARTAEVRLLRSQRDRDAARRAQEHRTRKELRLAIKEIAAVVDGVTAQMRNTENRHAALPIGAPNPVALEKVLGRLRTALRVGPNSSDHAESNRQTDMDMQDQAAASEDLQFAAAEVDEEPPSAFGPSPAAIRASESDNAPSRRRRLSASSAVRPRTTAR